MFDLQYGLETRNDIKANYNYKMSNDNTKSI